MTDQMNKFWEQLRNQAADPQGFTPLTDAEAERRMAEAGEEPMSEEEIAKIVRTATAEGPQGIVHRDIEKPQVHYFMKVAAAVLITVSLVAGVVVGKAVIWPERTDHSRGLESLEYRDAILIAVNGQEQESARNDSLGRVLLSTRAGIRGLQQARADGILSMLRETINSPTVFEERDLSRVRALEHPVKDNVKFIQDPANPLGDRVRRQRELGEQLQLGILTLKKVHATEKADGLLWDNARLALKNLRRQLGQ